MTGLRSFLEYHLLLILRFLARSPEVMVCPDLSLKSADHSAPYCMRRRYGKKLHREDWKDVTLHARLNRHVAYFTRCASLLEKHFIHLQGTWICLITTQIDCAVANAIQSSLAL